MRLPDLTFPRVNGKRPHPNGARPGALRLAGGLLPDLAALALLLGLPWLYFWRLFATGPDAATFPDGDFTELHLPLRLFAARELLAGHLPGWNPFVFGGTPALPDPQYALLYPIHWLLPRVADPADPVAFARALEAEAPLHLALAGAFTYLLGRSLFGLRLPALLAAVAFAFGGFATSFPVPQMNILATAVWLPLVLWLLHRGALSGNPAPYALAGLAAGIATLAGHPQMALYVVGTSLLWAIWTGWRAPSRLAAALGVLVFAVVAAGIAAAQWLPTSAYLDQTVRANLGYRFAGGGFPPRELAGLLLSNLPFGAAALYSGAGVLAFAALGAGLRVDHARATPLFWLLLALGAVLLALGAEGFLHPALYALLPPLRPIRDQERAAFLLAFALAILAGYGLRAALAEPDRAVGGLRRTAAALGGLTAILAAAGTAVSLWAAVAPAARGPVDQTANSLWLAALFAGVTFALLRFRLATPRAGTGWGLLVVLVVLLDLAGASWRTHLVERPPSALVPFSPLVEAIRTEAANRMGQFRIASEGLLPGDGNAGALHALEDLVGNSPLALAAWRRFEARVEEPRRWALLGVRYVITRRQIADPRLEPLASEGDARLYRLRADLQAPRARFVQSAIVAPSEADFFAMTNAADPTFAVLAQAPPTALDAPLAAPLAVGYERPDTDRIVLRLEAPGSGLVLPGEVLVPGWSARALDGSRSYPLLAADGGLIAIPVEPGPHAIVLRYEPPRAALGRQLALAALALATVAVLSGGLIALVRGWRRRPRPEVAA